jgi:hypothetical protein
LTRGQIITRFRQEHPEITTNLASDAVLQAWSVVGNRETAIKARLIRGETTFSSIVGEDTYDLNSNITNFYDIDEFPGSGVVYDNDQLQLESPGTLDVKRPSWRTTGNGVPKDYYRRNQNLVLGRKASAVKNILVYTVLLPNAMDDDTKEPFNELPHLVPFHYSLVLYLKMRAFGGKIKKPDAAQAAVVEYENYIKWIKKEIDRGIYREMQIRPPTNYRGTGRYRTRR